MEREDKKTETLFSEDELVEAFLASLGKPLSTHTPQFRVYIPLPRDRFGDFDEE